MGTDAVTPTPLPYKKLLPLAIIYFIEAFVFTNLFSYVGYMVYDFHLTTDEDKVGYYAGYLGSTFSVAGFLSSFWWGKLSDRFGRRPVLLFGCFGGLISNLAFGFSTTLEMAIACRFAAGLLNGNVGVVKGYAAYVCDKTNQAKGVGVMQLGFALGCIIGPLVGGILSRPCKTFDLDCSSSNLFFKFPYLLPNLIACLASLLAIITLIIYLPNDTKIGKPVELKQMKKSTSVSEGDEEISVTYSLNDEPDGATLHGQLTKEDSTLSLSGEGLLGVPRKPTLSERLKRWWVQKTNDKNSIFMNKNAMRTVLSYSILGASFTMFDEAFPLFAMAEKNVGGLGFQNLDIGIVGAITGVAQLVIQLSVFFPITKKLGFVRAYRMGLLIGTLLFFNYPTLNFVADNKKALWVFITIACFSRVFCGQFSFGGATALVSNSCSITQVGSINGFSQSFVALLRAFSPALAGNLLAWGFSNGYSFPLNQYLVFILMSLALGTSLFITMFLPRSLDYPYEEPKTVTLTEGDQLDEQKGLMLKDPEEQLVIPVDTTAEN